MFVSLAKLKEVSDTLLLSSVYRDSVYSLLNVKLVTAIVIKLLTETYVEILTREFEQRR